MSEEQTEQTQEQQVQANPVEDKARAQGWVEKESFKGDPAKWVDAETFVKRGEDILPILKERNERLVQEMQEMKKSFGEFAQYAKKAEERAFQKAMEEIAQRELQAVADQDVEGFQAAQKEKQALEKEKPVIPEVKTEDPLFTAFKEKNKWYVTDPALAVEADAMGAAFAQRGLPYSEILSKVETTMKALHPERFTNSRRESPPAVEFQSDTGLPRKKTERTYENLPPDAQAACDKFIKKGIIKDKSDYVALYQWE